MELFLSDAGFDALQHMSQILLREEQPIEQGGRIEDIALAIRDRAGIEMWCVENWINRHGRIAARKLYFAMHDKMKLFTMVSHMLPPNPELAAEINMDSNLVHSWLADEEQVKRLTDDGYDILMQSLLYQPSNAAVRKANYEMDEMCYRILRHSKSRAEMKYAQQVPGMKNQAAWRSTQPGGKLHRIASQYPVWVNPGQNTVSQ